MDESLLEKEQIREQPKIKCPVGVCNLLYLQLIPMIFNNM